MQLRGINQRYPRNEDNVQKKYTTFKPARWMKQHPAVTPRDVARKDSRILLRRAIDLSDTDTTVSVIQYPKRIQLYAAQTVNVLKSSCSRTRTYLSHHQFSFVPASAVLQTLERFASVRCFSTTSKPLISTPPDAVTTHLPPRPRMKLHCGSTAFGVT